MDGSSDALARVSRASGYATKSRYGTTPIASGAQTEDCAHGDTDDAMITMAT